MDELDQWRESFEAFHARFGHLFTRSESRQQAAKYLRGLLSPTERKNGWQVAEAVGNPRPEQTQRLLYQVPWEADTARDILQDFAIEQFGDPEESRKGAPDPDLAASTVPEVHRLLDVALPLPACLPELRLAWSRWRRLKRLHLRRSHYRRRAQRAARPALLDTT